MFWNPRLSNQTRTHDMNLTFDKKSFSDHAFCTCGPILWNLLPKTLKASKKLDISKISLSKNLFKIMIKNFDFEPSLVLSGFSWYQFVLFDFFFCNVVLSRLLTNLNDFPAYSTIWFTLFQPTQPYGLRCFMSFAVVFMQINKHKSKITNKIIPNFTHSTAAWNWSFEKKRHVTLFLQVSGEKITKKMKIAIFLLVVMVASTFAAPLDEVEALLVDLLALELYEDISKKAAEVGRSLFSLATPTYYAAVAYIYVLP